MPTPEERLAELGLDLPSSGSKPPGVDLPFSFVNVRGTRALFSGHARHNLEGHVDGPFGRLGDDMDTQEGYDAARSIALCVLANLKAEIGDLSRIEGWARVFGMVTSTAQFTEQHLVVNGFSDLIIDVFGQDAGRHARSAIGVSSLPMGFAIEIEGEVLMRA